MRAARFIASALIVGVLISAGRAGAQANPPGIPQWAMIVHRLAMNAHDPSLPRGGATGVFPRIIPEYLPELDASCVMETYNLAAPTNTWNQCVFRDGLGTNGAGVRHVP